MASKPKQPKAAGKSELGGEKRPGGSPDSDVAEESSAIFPKETTRAAVASDSKIADAEVLGPANAATPSESGGAIEAGDPGVLLAQEPPTVPPTRSLIGLVFGGLIAGAIGYIAATFLPNAWADQFAGANSALSTTIEAQSARIDALNEKLETLAASSAEGGDTDPAVLSDQIDMLTARVDEISSSVGEADHLAARLEVLEARPILSVPDGSDAMAAQLDAFRSELDAVTAAARAEVEEAKAQASVIEAEAAKAAATAQRRAALSELDAALTSGAPFASILTTLDGAPDELAALAADGVPTLASLRAEFPGLARAALSRAADAPENASTGQRLATYLRRQTNARSLSPRDGDDVDAILSRAEAMLQGGELPDALGEIVALPQAPRAVFAPWIAEAESRIAAVSAFVAMSEILN